MIEGIFFINSALNVTQLSVYSEEERFKQTLKTIESIDKYCSNNVKYMFDSSPIPPKMEYFQELVDKGVKIVNTGNHSLVKKFSLMGHRSISECISFILFIEWFKKNLEKGRRIYKLSGRYELNENFQVITNSDSNFVFTKALDSWMDEKKRVRSGVEKLFRLRLWSMDFELLDVLEKELHIIMNDCQTFDIDVEHSYYKNLKKYNIREIEKIGVCGNIAPTGEYIDE